MKERKPLKTDSAEQNHDRAGWAEAKPLRPEATMQMDVRLKRARGRLSREDQRRLGDILHRVYDDVVKEGVPDRFEKLLKQLDAPRSAMSPAGVEPTANDVSCSPASEHVVAAQGHDKPQDKGST